MSKSETARGSLSCVNIGEKGRVTIEKPKSSDGPKLFTFDFAYGDNTEQSLVYDELGKPLVTRALEGFNGTIFAYGQTGSGKTWSMMGIPSNPGLIPSLNHDLFSRIQGAVDSGTDKKKVMFLVTVTYVEIYNEVLRDLLNPTDQKLEIRESTAKGVFIQGVSQVIVKSEEALMKLVQQGSAVRRVAETKMNSESSRSHSVFTIKVERRTVITNEDTTKEVLLTSKINLIDLAGSERADKTGATGSTLKEGAAINKSLMALGNVINALGENATGKSKKHIPYRDSKLTRLLQESLGGNSSTLMLAALSPADYNYDETMSTLNYAKRAKLIENKVEKNEDVKEKEIRKLKEEIDALKKALEGKGGVGGGGDRGEEPNEELLAKLKELESTKNETWEERERLAAELEKERQNNINSTMGSVINDIKEKKIAAMKAIKHDQHEKGKAVKQYKELQATVSELKKGLENEMSRYQKKQNQFDRMEEGREKDSVEEEMAELLDAIEQGRAELVSARSKMKDLKLKSEQLEEEIISKRAELVANADLLSQNDNLRKAIQKEEMEKMEAMKEEYLAKELEEERKRMKDSRGVNRKEMIKRLGKMQVEMKKERSGMETYLQNQVEMMTNEKAQMEAELVKLRAKVGELEERVVDAESACEEKDEEILGLREKLMDEGRMKRSHANLLHKSLTREKGLLEMGKREALDDRYHDFAILMDGFEEERKLMAKKNQELRLLLQEALDDVVYLSNNRR